MFSLLTPEVFNIKPLGKGDSDPTWNLSDFKGFHVNNFGSQQKKTFRNTPHGVLLPAPHWRKNFQPHRVRSGPSHPKASGRMLHGHAWPTFDPWELTPCHPYGKNRRFFISYRGVSLRGFLDCFDKPFFFRPPSKCMGRILKHHRL